jgi:hypothetical protein
MVYIILCGDGFMYFIHRLNGKILKIKIMTFRKLALLPSSGEWRGEEKNTFLLPSIHLRTEAESASEMSWF